MNDDPFDLNDPFDLLAVSWSYPEWTEKLLMLYVTQLADVPADDLTVVVQRLVRVHEGRRPEVALIRRQVAERCLGFPSEGDATRQALSLGDFEMQRQTPLGAMSRRPAGPVVHPAVQAAYDAAGVEHVPSFLRAYRAERERLVVDAAAGSLTELTAGRRQLGTGAR